jgi:hypothetical protein
MKNCTFGDGYLDTVEVAANGTPMAEKSKHMAAPGISHFPD